MKLAQFLELWRTFSRQCEERIVGPGAEQYDLGDFQKFETLPIEDLFDWAEEELQDAAVYAGMLLIRLRKLRVILEDHPEQPLKRQRLDLKGPAYGKPFPL